MAAAVMASREGCVDLNAYVKELYENGRCTDFKIVSTDEVDVGTSFKSASRCYWTIKLFFRELQSELQGHGAREIKLLEPSVVVKIIIQYIYNYPDKDIKYAVNRMTLNSLVILCGAAKKYLLTTLRQWNFDKWVEKYHKIRPATPTSTTDRFCEPADISRFISALESLGVPAQETDIDSFLFVIAESLRDGRGIFELSLNTRQAALKAKPGLLQTFVESYLQRTKDTFFPARCASCDTQWKWNKFATNKQLACPCCKAENTWVGYLLHSTVVKGW